MSESAESQRRRRKHRAGDHSLCDATRCEALAAKPPAEAPGAASEAEREPGGIEVAVRAYVGSLPYRAGDPRAILGEVAVQLARRVDDTGALPAAVRELRVLLVQLAEVPNGPSGFVDEIRVRRAQRRLDVLLAQTG